MGHEHQHGASQTFGRAFAIGIALNLAFVIVELVYGKLSHSLALVSDALHNLSDVLSLILAWAAALLAKRSPTANRTYGLRRSSVLAALANAVVLLISLGAIAWEAIQRLGSQGEVAGKTVIMVAAIGVLINGFTAFLFASGRKGDLNIRGAFLHFAADALVSLAVVLAGIVILYAGWSIVDPLLTLGIVAVIFWGTWGLLRDSLNLALDAVPEGIDPASVQDCLSGFQNVVGVHDLHVWGMSTTEAALTAHLVVSEPVCNNEYLKRIESEIHSKFGIEHITVQIEVDDGVNRCRCRLENDAIS